MAILFEPVPEWLKDELPELVEEELLHLRMPHTRSGFRYHVYAISQTVRDPSRTDFITKELYPEIAKLYGTTASRVERAMRTAVMRCWEDGDRKALDEMAGYQITERPTNSEFIQIVAKYIRRR